MPLVINSLRGGHTQAYRNRRQKQFQETSRTPAFGQHVIGLKTLHNKVNPTKILHLENFIVLW